MPLNTCQNKYIYKHSINPKYIKQWIICHFKTSIWLGTFRYNCTRSQLNNKGGGELYQIKRSRGKTEIDKDKEIMWWRVNKYLLKSPAQEIVYDMKSNLCNVFILKCVSITNISIEDYMEGVIR